MQGLRSAVGVRTGYVCNNACRFCIQGDKRDTVGDLDDETVREKIAEAMQGGTTHPVVLAGGEVTLRPELAEWIALASQGGARKVIIQTNGRMLAYRAYVRGLVDAGCSILAVAIHGATADCHDWLTRSPGSFLQAIRGIRNVRAAGAIVWVNTVITRSNYRHLPEIVELCHRLGVPTMRFLWPHPVGEADSQTANMIPHPELAAPYLDRTQTLGSRLGC